MANANKVKEREREGERRDAFLRRKTQKREDDEGTEKERTVGENFREEGGTVLRWDPFVAFECVRSCAHFVNGCTHSRTSKMCARRTDICGR